MRHLICFCRDETGTISADWVVLTASTMIMAVVLVASVKNGTSELGPVISAEIEQAMN